MAGKTKITKETLERRISDITKLLVAGGEFLEIKQLAKEHNWGVSDRQLKRYLAFAYKRMSTLRPKEREELLSRHLAQRRALYARSVKSNDLHIALRAVQDEAKLQGLYASFEVPLEGAAKAENAAGMPITTPVIPLKERLIRWTAATSRNDADGVNIIESISPVYHAKVPDLTFAKSILPIQGATYILQQFECLIKYFYYQGLISKEQDAEVERQLNVLAEYQCYNYRRNRDAFLQYAKELGIEPDYLIKGNYQGDVFALFEEYILKFAPTAHQFNATLEIEGFGKGDMPPVQHYVNHLHQFLDEQVQKHDRQPTKKDTKR